jgi:hypothetical protein
MHPINRGTRIRHDNRTRFSVSAAGVAPVWCCRVVLPRFVLLHPENGLPDLAVVPSAIGVVTPFNLP